MSAETLRKAAELLRERAGRATSGPWHQTGDLGKVHDIYAPVGAMPRDLPLAERVLGRDARYIATMSPDVGLALADLLESLAYDRESNGEIDGRTWDLDIVPLARMILGGSE